MRRAPVLLALSALTAAAGLAAASTPPPPPSSPPPLPARAALQRNPAHPRLDPVLNQVWASRFAPSFIGERAPLHALVEADERIRVVVETAPGRASSVSRQLDALGGRLEATAGHLVFARVPVAQLPTLAGREGVLRVRRPHVASPHVVSQGVALHGALEMHGRGATGAGVKVGVLDCGGFSGYQALLGSELPGSVTLWTGGVDPVGPSVHGTACAEVVHDMAPDAELFFAHDDDEAEFYTAMDWLVSQGVDVISYSCGWVGAFPWDGSGAPHNTVNAKVEEARAAGVLVVTSAGNSADNDSYVEVYQQFPGYPFHDFDGNIQNGIFSWSDYGYTVTLTWDDWPADPATSGSSQDYSLELWWWDGASWVVVASSDNPQNGNPGELPYEALTWTPPVDEWYYLTVSKVNADRNHVLNLKKTSNGGFQFYRDHRSLTIPADSPAVVSVGAVHWNSLALEPFSSRGPTLGPGGTFDGGLLKPDLVAADAVSTVTYGASNGGPWPTGTGYFGTSAAAPHVAGAAALLLSANPSLDADALARALLQSAEDHGVAGPDTDSGFGILAPDNVLLVDGFESGDTSAW